MNTNSFPKYVSETEYKSLPRRFIYFLLHSWDVIIYRAASKTDMMVKLRRVENIFFLPL